jgi:hypothetical protein
LSPQRRTWPKRLPWLPWIPSDSEIYEIGLDDGYHESGASGASSGRPALGSKRSLDSSDVDSGSPLTCGSAQNFMKQGKLECGGQGRNRTALHPPNHTASWHLSRSNPRVEMKPRERFSRLWTSRRFLVPPCQSINKLQTYPAFDHTGPRTDRWSSDWSWLPRAV